MTEAPKRPYPTYIKDGRVYCDHPYWGTIFLGSWGWQK